MAKARNDSYLNALIPRSIRGRMSNYSADLRNGAGLFPQPILSAQYMLNGFARTICDKPAEEMTRAGFDIVGMDEDLAQGIKARLEELNATKAFNEAIKWRRAFGGGLIVLGIRDGGGLEDEVNEDGVTDIEFMRVYDRFEAIPESRYEDPSHIKFGEIEIWQISPKIVNGQTYKVHESRCLIFDGESVTNETRASNDGWGSSVIQICFEQALRTRVYCIYERHWRRCRS